MRNQFVLTCLSAVLLNTAAPARAAIFTWTGPTDISGDSDVLTTGTLVNAFNIGSDNANPSTQAVATTINGVSFQPWEIPNEDVTSTNGNYDISSALFPIGFGPMGTESSFGSAIAPYSSLSANYKTMLGTGAAAQDFPILTLHLGGLTSGQDYILQLWGNDSSLEYGGFPFPVFDLSFSSFGVIDPNTTDAPGGKGQFLIGTFTAVLTDEYVALGTIGESGIPILNGFQLRTSAIPEPNSLSLLALGGLLTLRRRNARVQGARD